MISIDHLLKEICDFTTTSTLSSQLCGHRRCSSGDIMTLVCHVILEDNVINKSCDFMVESPSW